MSAPATTDAPSCVLCGGYHPPDLPLACKLEDCRRVRAGGQSLPPPAQTRPATVGEAREWLADLPTDALPERLRLRPWLVVGCRVTFLDWLRLCLQRDTPVSRAERARALADARRLFDVLHPALDERPADAS